MAPDAVSEASVMRVKGLEMSEKARTGYLVNTVWRFWNTFFWSDAQVQRLDCWMRSRRGCYRCLGPPTLFLTFTLSTIPLLVGDDNQWWRDLFRDLGPVHRWKCSKHHLLARLRPLPLLCSISLYFRLIYILVSIIMPYIAFCHHAYAFMSAWSPHLSNFIIMLTTICHSFLPS